MMGPHKNLKVWEKAMLLVTKIYKETTSYPTSETYGLVGQMRKAVVSITSNIAEGYGRTSNNDLLLFLHHALASSNELDSQIEVSKNIGYLSEGSFKELDTLNEEVNKMLKSLIYTRTNSTDLTSKP